MDLFIIILIVFIPAIAQLGIMRTYSKNKVIKNNKDITGFEVARKILDENGLNDMYIVEVRGNLTDHYDPSQKVVRLSSDIYHGNSIASAAIAAHECGHAVQDKEGYAYMRFRSLIFPVVNIATSFSYWIIILGFLFEIINLVYVGIALTSLGLLFQVVTLPVEINASTRGMSFLKKYKLINSSEENNVHSVLSAAAMTYVAGVLASALQILRLLLMANRDN